MPIPFAFPVNGSSPSLIESGGEIFLKWFDGISFRLHFGRDKSNNQTIVKKILNKEYDLSNSSIQVQDRKIFLLLCVGIPKTDKELNNKLSVGVDLGINTPAYCALSEGHARLALGNKEDFLKMRLQMQSRRRRLQRALKLTKGGKGRGKKLKALEAIKEKERNYVKTYNHMLSHQIIKFAEDYNAGVIKLEFLEGFAENEKNSFILRNWSYFELQQFIKYKAQQKNIEVVFVDPYHTSQTCSLCGNYSEGQRVSQSLFICANEECKNHDDKGINADYNAALNIARSNMIVSSKKECQFYKSKESEKVL